ncbi:SpoIIIAH-like family protein [Candidatus Formimonas warabiya]|uniref:SpoIIIAH-like family protein n=1 Tax=Formimonas warabiya TaxID=1761012 RepID=A0A3G1KNI8_FORW1|nr:SpoIIIAH-like family protein [Candidatus Formimonas warabiya]ATW24029.1 hypothetical protein DCMF_03795 [Candidatus Formimonas warabiya]
MMMLTCSRKKVLLGVLLICLIWLGYFSFAREEKTTVSVLKNDETNSGEKSTLVVPDDTTAPDTISVTENTPVIDGEDYFVNYRMEREKIRSEQVEILREIVDNPNSVSDVRKEAQEKMLTLTQTMENELKLENLIRAKDFPDAVVLIQPESVMVVLKGAQLTDVDSTKIADLVANTTGCNYEDIIISTKD